jgi:hypothetical protein
VLKRTYSCGSEHVILRPTSPDITRHLRCLTCQRRTSRRKAAQDTERWFYQEFVQDLQRIGEFRVFVVTMIDESATRGRKGVVVEVVHTLELEDRDLVVAILSSFPAWPGGDTTYNRVDVYELKGLLCMFSTLYETSLTGIRILSLSRSHPEWTSASLWWAAYVSTS